MSQSRRPNVILIFTDQQRWDSLGCYGNRFVETPNLDRLAAEGMRFDHAFTPVPVCTPARCTMWTGVYPHTHGLTQNVSGFVSGVANAIASESNMQQSVWDMLGETDYDLAYIGKWHLGDDNPGPFSLWEGWNSLGGHWTGKTWESDYKPTLQTDTAVAYLRSRADKAGQPFMLVQSFYPPHDPYQAPRQFHELYRDAGVHVPGYYAAVTALDHEIGRMLEALDETGLADSTLVIFYSDHGEHFNYRPGASHKWDCHDEATRVPFIARWPGHVEPGTARSEFIGLQDLMPTLLELAGAQAPDYLHGRSLAPLLEGRDVDDWRDYYYVENEPPRSKHQERCLRTTDWKLILSENGRNYLYDLNMDPEEELNLYNVPRDDSHFRFRHYPSQHEEIKRLARRLGDVARELDDEAGIRLAEQAEAEMDERMT